MSQGTLMVTMALAGAMVACKAAAPGKAGEQGEPGKPADPALQPPYVALEIPDLPGLVEGTSNEVDLSKAFRDPEGKTLVLDAESGDETKATVDVSGTTLTVTGVGVGTTSVVVTATDPDKLSVGQSFQVTVTAAPPKPEPPVTIDDVKTKYPSLAITPTTAADISKDIELPAEHELMSENPAVVTVAMKVAAASAPATSIRWASATDATNMTKNVWVVTAVSKGATNVDVLDTTGASVHTIRVTVTADPPPDPVPPVAPTVKAGGIDAQELYLDDGPMDIVLTTSEGSDKGYFTHESAITYDVSSSPSGVVNPVEANGTLTLTPLVTGPTRVTVVATADGASTAPVVFTVTVMAGSAPKPAEPVAPEVIQDLEDIRLGTDWTTYEWELKYHFSHDSSEITYSLSVDDETIATAAIEGSGIDAELIVTAQDTGRTRVIVMATADGESVTEGFNVTVQDGPVAHPYSMGEIADIEELAEGEIEEVDVADNFADPLGQDWRVEAESSDKDVATVEANGTTVTVTAEGPGTATITVNAVDDDGLESRPLEFDVTVAAAAPDPDPDPEPMAPKPMGMIDDITLALMASGGPVTHEVDVTNKFSDSDSDVLTYTASSNNDMVATAMAAGSIVTVTVKTVGKATITVTATDGELMANQMFMVTVTEPAVTSEVNLDGVGDSETYSFPSGEKLRSRNVTIADAKLVDSATNTWEIAGKRRGNTTIDRFVGTKDVGDITVTVGNTAPSKKAKLTPRQYYTLQIAGAGEEYKFSDDKKRLFHYVVNPGASAATLAAARTAEVVLEPENFFEDDDEDDLTYRAESNNPHIRVEKAMKDVIILDMVRKFSESFELTMTAMDDEDESEPVTVIVYPRVADDAAEPLMLSADELKVKQDPNGEFSDITLSERHATHTLSFEQPEAISEIGFVFAREGKAKLIADSSKARKIESNGDAARLVTGDLVINGAPGVIDVDIKVPTAAPSTTAPVVGARYVITTTGPLAIGKTPSPDSDYNLAVAADTTLAVIISGYGGATVTIALYAWYDEDGVDDSSTDEKEGTEPAKWHEVGKRELTVNIVRNR